MLKRIGVIIICLLFAFLVTRFLLSVVFLANTPRIRNNIAKRLNDLYINPATNYLAKITRNISLDNLIKGPEREMAKGVFVRTARGKDNVTTIRIDENQMDLVATVITTRKGKRITIWHGRNKQIPQGFLNLLIND